jgi:hypothetical protein
MSQLVEKLLLVLKEGCFVNMKFLIIERGHVLSYGLRCLGCVIFTKNAALDFSCGDQAGNLVTL